MVRFRRKQVVDLCKPYQPEDIDETTQSHTSFGSDNLILQSQPSFRSSDHMYRQVLVIYRGRPGNGSPGRVRCRVFRLPPQFRPRRGHTTHTTFSILTWDKGETTQTISEAALTLSTAPIVSRFVSAALITIGDDPERVFR